MIASQTRSRASDTTLRATGIGLKRASAIYISVLALSALLLSAAPAHAIAGDDDGDGLSDEKELALGTDPHRVDTDGDYLSDADEVARGTDPTRADSDGDGLPDYSEIAVHHTDPVRKDSDGGGIIDGEEVLIDHTDPTRPEDDRLDSDHDGLPNALEAQLGTDPFASDTDHDLLGDGDEDANHDGVRGEHETDATDPDSDGDGLPDGVEVLVYRSDPFARDTDDDGLVDGEEGALRTQGADCLDLTLADSDHDGLTDGEELDPATPSDPCTPDTDGDGVYDAVERSDGTDPRDPKSFKPDADGDHLSDAYESEVSHSDPAAADSDGDGLPDGEEAFELIDLERTDPNDADSDDDGILDGNESRIVGERLQAGTDALRADTDGDGLADGLELGLAMPQASARDPDATRSALFHADHDPATHTDPQRADTDGDGLADGDEDRDRDGVHDSDETDPTQPDTDLDGLDDGWEAKYAQVAGCGIDPLNPADAPRDPDHDGLSTRQEYKALLRTAAGVRELSTNPCAEDTDRDGLPDRLELHSGYVGGQSDPTRADSDDDGLADGLEDKNHDGVWQEGEESDPTRADTDGDGLRDGDEDRDHDGETEPAETDPRRKDSDDDGIEDGRELTLFGTDPTSSDTDADMLPDGLELALAGGADPLTSSDPRVADTDGDGIADGVEDLNHDGALDADETQPRLPDTDGDGLRDGEEDANHDGVFDVSAGETDPRRADTDADFVSDREEVGAHPAQPVDFDGDGVIDALDDDSDDDGVPDAVEAQDEDLQTPCPDTDHDGQNDLRDRDSDNGGVPDGTEQNVQHTDRLDPRDDGRGWFEPGSSIRGSGCAVSAPRAGHFGWLVLLWAAWAWRTRRRLLAAVSSMAYLSLPLTAAAQEQPDARQTALDGSPYHMNPGGESVLATSMANVLAHEQWQVRVAAHHFADAIVVEGADGEVRRSILRNRQQLELAGALGLFGFVELSAHWAVALHQAATYPAQGLGAADAFGVTHPVLQPKITLLRQPSAPLSLGIEAPVTLGLWKPQAYMGHDGWSVRPAALVTWQWPAITAAISGGVDFLPRVRIYHTRDGSRFSYRAALQYAFQQETWRVALEWSASHRLADPWDRNEQTGQIAGGVAYRFLRDWSVDASVAAGVLGGIGQPAYRILASAAYRSRSAPPQPTAAVPPSQPAPPIAPPPPAAQANSTQLGPVAAPVAPVAPPAPEPRTPAADMAVPQDVVDALQTPISFAVADSTFDPVSLSQLERVVHALEAQPALRVRIEGHSDALGDHHGNVELSLRRARAVQDYLVQHSRDPQLMAARLESVGYGELRPVDSNTSEAGRARNRRVSFTVVDTGR